MSFDADIERAPVVAEKLSERSAVFSTDFQEWGFFNMAMLVSSATTFVQGLLVVNTALIALSLHMTEAEMTWIQAAVGLGSGSFMLFFGKTSSIFGCKLQVCIGLACLSVVSLITAFAPNALSFLVLCGLQGVGTAAVSPPVVGALFATYPEGPRTRRGTAFLGCGNPVGFILGSISSGFVTLKFDWRGSFVVSSLYFFILTIISIWAMPKIPASSSKVADLKKFDWLGAFLITTTMALICTGLTEGPQIGWLDVKTLALILSGGLLGLGCFVLWEYKCAMPLMDLTIWKNVNFTLCVLATFFGYMSFITNQFWISLYMQNVQHILPLMIAVRLLPQAIFGIAWSFMAEWLVKRIKGTYVMAVGAVAYFVGALLQLFIRKDTPYWHFLFPALLVTVVGADFQFVVSTLYISKKMPSQAALGSGILQTVMRLSVALGLAITAAAYNSAESTQDIMFAFRRAYICSVIFAGLGVVCVFFMRLDRDGAPPAVVENIASTSALFCNAGFQTDVDEVKPAYVQGVAAASTYSVPTSLRSDGTYDSATAYGS
ncbi:major facilitator superfamily domain-containing protein [Calycina marina]|uniref:Major facilitator superfamily domain-containing protein n=1 Tax=Calycina marina TaxID=1763456 RepID=A0A9P7YXS3_9HELO|nr:major facilitator superfamily domain-containing protein [Calycina marina]